MNTLEHMQTLAAPILASGEEPLAAVRVNYNGTIQSNALGTNPSIGGLADPDAAGPDPDALVTFPAAKQMAVLLTGGRVLTWSLGFSGKPKQYVGEVPLTAIREVHAGEIRFGPLVRIVLKSHAAVDLEVMRGEDADGFIAELKHLVDGDGAAPTDGAAPAADATTEDATTEDATTEDATAEASAVAAEADGAPGPPAG